MSEIRFSNNDLNFKTFTKESIKAASSGIDPQSSVKNLESLAYKNDGYISTKERLLIQAFKENPKVIANISIPSLDNSFSLNIKENPIRKKLEPRETALDFARSNPLEANVYDPGITKLNVIERLGSQPELKLQEALNKIANKQISDKSNSLVSSFDSEINKKYASAYITELITNRQPKLSEKDILNLLNKIESISKTDYAEEIGSGKDLALSSLHDISFPSNVSQNNSGTCVGTSAQIQLILRSPDKYLDMIDNLAKNKSYDTSKGSLQPNWTFSKPFERTARTISSSLVQNALMNEGRGGNYDSSVIDSVSRGLYLNQAKKMYETMLGTSVTTKSLRDGFSRTDLFKSIADSKPSLNNPVHVTIDYMDSGRDRSHAVNVISLKPDSVTIINPWGREETFSSEKLKNKLLEVILINKK